MNQNVNLYDPALRVRRDPLSFNSAIAMVVAAVACVLLGAAAARWAAADAAATASRGAAELLEQQMANKAAIAARAASSKPDPALQAEIARAQRTLLQRRSALQALDAGAIGPEAGFSSRLEALARQSIDGLWLTGLVLHQDDVLLRGRALDPALIPAYVQRLEHEPSLQGRAFKALEVSRPLDAAPTSVQTPPTQAPLAAPGPVEASAAASSPLRAEYVEFTLTGSNHDEALAGAAKP